jgi:hypothetical protein
MSLVLKLQRTQRGKKEEKLDEQTEMFFNKQLTEMLYDEEQNTSQTYETSSRKKDFNAFARCTRRCSRSMRSKSHVVSYQRKEKKRQQSTQCNQKTNSIYKKKLTRFFLDHRQSFPILQLQSFQLFMNRQSLITIQLFP